MSVQPGMGGLRRRVLKGIGGQAFGQLAGFIVQLAGVPLYLAFWGVDLYGEWLILAALPGWLTISDLGFTTATAHAMTMEIAAGDRAAALTSFRTTWWLVSGLSLLVGLAAAAVALWMPLDIWLNLSLLGAGDTAIIVLLLALHVVLNLQTGLLNAGFHAEGEYGEGVALLSLARLVEFILVAIAVVAGAGPVGAATALVVGRMTAWLFMRWRLYLVASWLSFGLGGFSAATARRLFGPALGFTGYLIGHALSIQGPILIIGATLGPAAVVPFATLRTLLRMVQQVLQSVSTVARPEIGLAAGRGDRHLMRRLNREACRVALWLLVGATAVLVPFGDYIVSLWTVGRVAATQPLFGVLTAVMVATAIWHAASWALQAVNRVQGQAILYVALNSAAIVVMVAFTARFGLILPALALLAADAVLAVFVVWQSLKYLEERPAAFLASLLVPPFHILGYLRGRH